MAGSELQNIVTFNGVRYPCGSTVGVNNIARFEGKIVSGDQTRDSDNVMSSKIWTSFTGGIGVDTLRGGTDDGRFWFGNLWTQHPYQLSLGRRTDYFTTCRYPLGDLSGIFYAADNNQVFPWTEATTIFGAALTGTVSVPTWRGVAWNGKQYVPCGSNGYFYHTASAATQSTAINVVEFLDWDNRLLALVTDGTLQESFDGTTWNVVATLNTSETPRRLIAYIDRQEQDTAYIVTTKSVYAYDPVIGILQKTKLTFPSHPDNGYGAAVWRPGEDLYVSAGIVVYRFGLSSVSSMGPDRDHGLPYEYRGVIRDLCSEHNMMVAYVEGVMTAVAAATPVIEFDVGMEMDLEVQSTDALCMETIWVRGRNRPLKFYDGMVVARTKYELEALRACGPHVFEGDDLTTKNTLRCNECKRDFRNTGYYQYHMNRHAR